MEKVSALASARIQNFLKTIRPDEPRDWSEYYSPAANLTVDTLQDFHAIGLDFSIINRGAAALTVAFDRKTAITIAAGAAYGFRNRAYSLVVVTSAVQYEMDLAGVHLR